MNFEESIQKAIADQFFNTQVVNYIDGIGNTYYHPAPALNMVQTLFSNNKQAILDAVQEKLDIEKLSEQISKDLLDNIANSFKNEYATNSWQRDTRGDNFRKELKAAVIEKVAQAQADKLMETVDCSEKADS